jgi:hypothetical protein
MRLRTFPTRTLRRCGRLINRIPGSFIAALAAAVLVAILYTVATHEPKETRAYAEVTLYRNACTVDASRQLNASTCLVVSRGVYRLAFTTTLEGSTPVASRGSCCPGPIAASMDSDHTVLLVVPPRVRGPIRASVFVP